MKSLKLLALQKKQLIVDVVDQEVAARHHRLENIKPIDIVASIVTATTNTSIDVVMKTDSVTRNEEGLHLRQEQGHQETIIDDTTTRGTIEKSLLDQINGAIKPLKKRKRSL